MTRRSALAACAVLIVLVPQPAAALTGPAPALPNASQRPVVMIVSNRGSFCTGTVIARDVVLTAAHCVLPGADYKLAEYDAQRQPILRDIATIARHPQFSMAALKGQRATADVALLRLARPLSVAPAPLAPPRTRIAPGERFVVMGYGLSVRGDGKTGGTLRQAALAAAGQPGNLQLRLTDPAGGALGACTGDSGAPAFDATGASIVGVVSWSTGPGGASGCGGLTGITPIELYRGWIEGMLRKWGGR